ncbi:MAG: hypothetical protein QW101_03770 [Ignisphaera sp.]|uniref:Transcription elongation factor n=1 Tax=Ignisphaera aggregans TaxID=334771 RepID=A0A7J3MZP1_9CREN
MAKRRSKWRRTWQVVKKMMQEARKVKAYESLKQCPVCGNPHSLTISIKTDKTGEKRSAEVICNVCGFEHRFNEIPSIADEFWIYSKVLDIVHSETVEEKKEETTAETVSSEASVQDVENIEVEPHGEESEIPIDIDIEEEPQ